MYKSILYGYTNTILYYITYDLSLIDTQIGAGSGLNPMTSLDLGMSPKIETRT